MFVNRNIKMPEINKNQALILDDTNILDNPIGTARGIHYKYSKSMADHRKAWSFDEMNGFLTKPKDWIKGTKMSFV